MQKVSRLITSFTPAAYNLSINLERIERRFHGVVTIQGSSHQPDGFRLHAKDLTIDSISVDGRTASFSSHDNDEIEILQQGLTENSHTVVIAFSGKITDQMHGLYPCYFTHDGVKKELLATQFESHHAREVFPCIDEPEAKATFSVTLTTEKDLTVLSNMPIKQQANEGEHTVTSFETTPRMSSYLLAWSVGELHSKSAMTKAGVEVNVWATPAQPPSSLEFALDFAVRTIEYFEDYFGVKYPLPKSDHLALPDFTSGAMENWGLITYREIALLADPETSTIDAKHYVAMVIAHELSHQWFGNLVTMEWWDNLWLNESFANFMENLPIHDMHPEWNIWMEYASTWSLSALRRDAIDGVQPVQIEVNHPDEITSVFDGAIVYGKGGRLIGMLHEYVGDQAFRAGLKIYFTKFQYKNTTGDDLWDCFEAASGKPVRDFMNKWVLRSGYPVVHVTPDGLKQEQFFIGEHTPSDKIWPIPLAAEPISGLPRELNQKNLPVAVSQETRLNVGNWSHFVTNYQDIHFAQLLDQVQHLLPLDRLQLINERTLLTRSGHVANATLIDMLLQMKNEQHESVWSILGLAFSELKKFVDSDETARSHLKKLALDISEPQFRRLGWITVPNEPENDTKLRPIILSLRLYGDDKAVIEEACNRYQGPDTINQLDPELRSVILTAIVKRGITLHDQKKLVESYIASQSSAIREDILGALVATESPEQIEHLLSLITDTSIVRLQDVSHWYVYLVRSRLGKTVAWRWLRANWSWIEECFGGDKSYDDFVRYSAGALSTRQQLDEFTSFFSSMKDQAALKRVIELGRIEISARVELIEGQAEAVQQRLANL